MNVMVYPPHSEESGTLHTLRRTMRMVRVNVVVFFRIINGAYCHKNHQWTRGDSGSPRNHQSTTERKI